MGRNNKLKIGIATPIHEKDVMYMSYHDRAIKDLESKAYISLGWLNDGSKGLKYYRTFLFDHLFDLGCDVVLQCSVDHYIHKDILNYVDENKITTFAYLKYKLSYVIDFIRFKLSPDMWTGCYSITKEYWDYFKESMYYRHWKGGDYAIVCFADEIGYPIKRVRTPKYTLMNPSKADPFEDLENYPLWKKIIRKISWADH